MQEPFRGFKLFLVTCGLSLATFMQVLDTSIANVSIPYIAGDMAVSPNQGTWVITSFAVGNAIFIPMTGELSRRFGAVRTITWSIILFTAFSWICGIGFTFPVLVGARFFQGAVAGPLIPLSQSLLMTNYPKEKVNLALSLFVVIVVVAPILGPILGGWLTEQYRWNWIFYINIPVGIISALLVWSLLKNRESTIEKRPIDFLGFALLFLGIGLLQVMLDKGSQLDWFRSNIICFLAIISVICLVFLVPWELTCKTPLLDLKLFKDANFFIGTIITAISYMCFFGAVVITPLWLQTQMGYTATWAGLAVAPMGILPVIFGALLPKLMDKVSLKVIIGTCFAFFGLVYLFFTITDTQITFSKLAFQRLLFGIPITIYFTPLVTMSMKNLPQDKLSSASGLFHFFRLFAGGAGVSLSTYLWERRATLHHQQLIESVSPYNPNTQELFNPLKEAGLDHQAQLTAVNQIVDQQAYVLATNDVFWLSAIMCFALIAAVFFIKKQPKTAQN